MAERDSGDRLSGLSDSERAEFLARISGRGIRSARIERLSDTAEIPVSFAQQRLWFLDQLAPNNAYYNLPRVFRLTGPVDVQVMEAALTALVARHGSLRTSFATVDGSPSQVVAEPFPVSISVVNLDDLELDEALAEARRRAAAEAQQPFDLAVA